MKGKIMAIGSCTSCTPVTDAARLATNPKADINGDGKLTDTELQRSKLTEDVKASSNEGNSTSDNNYNSHKNKSNNTYVSSLSVSPLSSSNILLLAQNQG
jgi:hypothetical protein